MRQQAVDIAPKAGLSRSGNGSAASRRSSVADGARVFAGRLGQSWEEAGAASIVDSADPPAPINGTNVTRPKVFLVVAVLAIADDPDQFLNPAEFTNRDDQAAADFQLAA